MLAYKVGTEYVSASRDVWVIEPGIRNARPILRVLKNGKLHAAATTLTAARRILHEEGEKAKRGVRDFRTASARRFLGDRARRHR